MVSRKHWGEGADRKKTVENLEGEGSGLFPYASSLDLKEPEKDGFKNRLTG